MKKTIIGIFIMTLLVATSVWAVTRLPQLDYLFDGTCYQNGVGLLPNHQHGRSPYYQNCYNTLVRVFDDNNTYTNWNKIYNKYAKSKNIIYVPSNYTADLCLNITLFNTSQFKIDDANALDDGRVIMTIPEGWYVTEGRSGPFDVNYTALEFGVQRSFNSSSPFITGYGIEEENDLFLGSSYYENRLYCIRNFDFNLLTDMVSDKEGKVAEQGMLKFYRTSTFATNCLFPGTSTHYSTEIHPDVGCDIWWTIEEGDPDGFYNCKKVEYNISSYTTLPHTTSEYCPKIPSNMGCFIEHGNYPELWYEKITKANPCGHNCIYDLNGDCVRDICKHFDEVVEGDYNCSI